MCALSSLPRNLLIRIAPREDAPLLLRNPGERLPSHAVRHADGTFVGVLDKDGWMYIQHPREDVGLVGLPLCGDIGSWQSAFEDMRVDLFIRLPGSREWKLLERWEDLPFVP